MKPHDRPPNGILADGLMLYGSLERGAIVAKGFSIESADWRGASFARLNAFQDQLRALLALATSGRRLQFQWACDADYRSELQQYHEATQPITDAAVRRVRNERFTRYWQRMQARELRRERLALFLSIEITQYAGNVRTRGGLRIHYGKVLDQMRSQFEEFEATVHGIFGSELVLRPMDDRAHGRALWRFLNPGLAARSDGPEFDPALTIQEAAWHGEGVAQPEGFLLDGQFHAVLTLARWPQRTRPGIVAHLTGLPFLDYAITVNVTPLAARQEIRREEKAVERLQGEYAGQPRPSLLVALRKKERKVEALSGGFARPFHVTYVIRVWAPTQEALREKVAAVQAAVHAMDGAQYFECALPTTAKKLFFATWPGWTHSSYRHRELYAEDGYLADLLPFSATFTGDLAHAEALFDGSQGNVAGVSAQAGGSPQHALVCGMTGAGKSEFVANLFFQTAGCFDYTLLMDIGRSHQKFAEAMGAAPVVIHPDANLTLNYLDTQGLPLTQLHLATVVALVARMVGVPETAEQLALRQAQLMAYVQQLYRDTFTDWARQEPEKADEVRRFACAVHRWRERMVDGATPFDAFIDLRDRRAANDGEAVAFIAGLSEGDVTRFAQEAATERFIAHTACAFYAPEEFPTHRALVELLAYARLPEHDKTEIDRLATLLRAWSADGPYGKLFDGVRNLSLRQQVTYVEIGSIPKQAVDLKAAVGLLISGMARQHILSLPRAQRKRVLFEEVLEFGNIPGGEQILEEGYAQFRKHNCWVVSVVQQYGQFRTSRIRPVVIGNAKQFFLLRQSDLRDMEDLARDVGLPETAVAAIQQYPLPEQQPEGARFSSICYFTPTAQPPRCGTLRHIQEASHAA
jgi:hypothetical protein